MKFTFIASAAAASVLIASAAITAPFPQAQSSSTVATQLGYSSVKYAIAKNSHASFALPVTNRPIHMMVTCTTLGSRSIGAVTIISMSASSGSFLQWIGADIISVVNGKPTDSGSGSTSGTHIMYADSAENVDVQVNSGTAVRIVNKLSSSSVTVVVTMMY